MVRVADFYFPPERGPKDHCENIGDTLLSVQHKAFGYKEVTGKEIFDVKKVDASSKWALLFLLTLPLSAPLTLLGYTFKIISPSYHKKYTRIFNRSIIWLKGVEKIRKKCRNDHTGLDRLLKNNRIPIFTETKAVCEKGYYYLNGEQVELDKNLKDKMVRNTELFLPIKQLPSASEYDTLYEVVEEDTFDLCERYQHEGLHPVGLNMANARKAGGGVEAGSGAQEESLFRRSNYFQSLYPKQGTMYPIPNDGHAIYTPHVQVIRKQEKDGYAFRQPFFVDMIAMAFFNLRRKEEPKDYEKITRMKIRSILCLAAITGHDSLVLGAAGCGAFANDPHKIARWFKEELSTDEFKGRFKKVGFGIIYPNIVYKEQKFNLITVFKNELSHLNSTR